MNLTDILFNQIIITLIYIVLITTVVNAIMSFTQTRPASYRPFLYFVIAILIMNSFLEKKSGLVVSN